jgi:hypothetical protein
MQLHAGSNQTFRLIAPQGHSVTGARSLKGAPVRLERDGAIRVKAGTTISVTLQPTPLQ